jgi:hypothetical protein
MSNPPTGPAPRGVHPAVWAATCIGILIFVAGMINFVPAFKGTIMRMLETTERASVPSTTQGEQRADGGPVVAYRFHPNSTWQTEFIPASQIGNLIEIHLPHTNEVVYGCHVFLVNGQFHTDPTGFMTRVNRRGEQIPLHASTSPAYYRIDRGDFTYYYWRSFDPGCPAR